VQFSASTNSQSTSGDGNGVDSDVVNAEISENGLLYQTLTQVAASREGILQSAVNTSG
jgi:flagellar basal body rod protein FlgB